MELIGFFACVFILLWVSIAWLFCAPLIMGTWNIGGVPNTWKGRPMMLFFLAIIVQGWYMVCTNAPFTIVVTKV